MAKSRAQRKAERKRREQQQASAGQQQAPPASEAAEESKAQHDTQVPVSGDVAEVEAVIETGANVADYGEHTKAPEEDVPSGETAATENPIGSSTAPAVPGVTGGVEPGPPPSAEPVATPKPGKETRRQRKRREAKEREAAAAATEMKESPKTDKEKKGGRKAKPLPETKAEPKQRGRVVAFLASCWAELKRVQWPDRDTLIQASAVTIL
ncbi:MAG: preprotein translocase subunit SecE, partial [bacterium]